MKTPLGAGSLVLLHAQARPKSSEPYKLPALSATAIDEPFAAMQPVSTLPSVHAGIPPSTATRDSHHACGFRSRSWPPSCGCCKGEVRGICSLIGWSALPPAGRIERDVTIFPRSKAPGAVFGKGQLPFEEVKESQIRSRTLLLPGLIAAARSWSLAQT
ncbi:exported hypothetical protein [Candidatus Sulfopaludibacter sp. SbA3]|nr:exported hypothetical protein [Candidatus Sulfopaludibacter sp. SbA3]